MWAQRMAACEHAEVLQHNRLEERSHQLVRRGSDLLQPIDVGFGEHTALAGNLVQLDSVIFLLGQQFGRDLQLRVNFVDDRTGAAGAFVVHRRNFLLASGLVIIFEDDDLCVLPAQFDDRVDLGVKLLHCQRYSRDLLHKLCANLIRNAVSAGAGHEDARVVAVDAGLGFHPLQKL